MEKRGKIQGARGTKDVLPGETAAWQHLEAVARRTFALYGYGEIRVPMFEATELFNRGIGGGTDIVDKEMYNFLDRKGRSLTLRPEGTAGVVRAAIEHHLLQEGRVCKLYYIGPMFRYERPQAGRYREHWQMGVEAFGSKGAGMDAEAIHLCISLLGAFGLAGLRVQVNSIGCPGCRPVYLERLQTHLGSRLTGMCADCVRRFEINPLRLLDCKVESCRKELLNAPVMRDSLCADCAAHDRELNACLKALDVPFDLTPRLVRGFDYYTRTVFEIVSDRLGAQNALAGGGRYDRLVEELGGATTPAVGFSTGMERVLLACTENGVPLPAAPAPDVFLAVMRAEDVPSGLRIAADLRTQGIACVMDTDGRSLKSQMKRADQEGARFAAILGEDEMKNGTVTLKAMKGGAQQTLPLAELAAAVRSYVP